VVNAAASLPGGFSSSYIEGAVAQACELIYLMSPCEIAVLAPLEATVCIIYRRKQLAETGRLLHQPGSSRCWSKRSQLDHHRYRPASKWHSPDVP
jgi:hypothetical protein